MLLCGEGESVGEARQDFEDRMKVIANDYRADGKEVPELLLRTPQFFVVIDDKFRDNDEDTD